MQSRIVTLASQSPESVPAPNENNMKRLEANYYKVAIVTMILSVIVAIVAMFASNGKETKTEVTQGANSENTVICGDNNIVNQLDSIQEDSAACDDPLTFPSDDLCLAHAADLMKQEQYDDAITFLGKCVQFLDMSEEMRCCVSFNLGLCYLTTGVDYNQAVGFLDEVANQVKQAEVYYYLCHAYIRAERLPEALNAINQAIELDADQADYQTLRDILTSDTNVFAA